MDMQTGKEVAVKSYKVREKIISSRNNNFPAELRVEFHSRGTVLVLKHCSTRDALEVPRALESITFLSPS